MLIFFTEERPCQEARVEGSRSGSLATDGGDGLRFGIPYSQ